MKKLFLEQLAVAGRRVLVRVDFNVPLENGQITDDRRITESLPTIQWLRKQGARTILMSHLGRPDGQRRMEASLGPIAQRLGELLSTAAPLAEDCIGPAVEDQVRAMKNGDVLLLENLRFHAGEEANDPQFSAQLAALGELYVNDAFGAAHRAHASTDGAARLFTQRAAGFLMKKELDYLAGALEHPKRPFVAVIGGKKISGKIDVMQALLGKVDTLLVGGGMSYTFLKVLGFEVGKSLLEVDRLPMAGEILAAAKKAGKDRLLLPVDYRGVKNFGDADVTVVDAEKIPADLNCIDIGPKTAECYGRIIAAAKTVVWNGPVGVFENPNYALGTNAIAQAMAACTAAGGVTIVGGGDSAAAIAKAGLEDKVSHISTGGGASLEFLEGKRLPGVEALSDL